LITGPRVKSSIHDAVKYFQIIIESSTEYTWNEANFYWWKGQVISMRTYHRYIQQEKCNKYECANSPVSRESRDPMAMAIPLSFSIAKLFTDENMMRMSIGAVR
jgi:hypothetical protein